MSYATRQDLVDRYGAAELDRLDPANDDGDHPGSEAALADAAAWIDGEVGRLYVMPLPAGTYPLLRGAACALVRSRLYDDRAPDRVRQLSAHAKKVVRGVAEGRTRLLDLESAEPPRRQRVLAGADGETGFDEVALAAIQ